MSIIVSRRNLLSGATAAIVAGSLPARAVVPSGLLQPSAMRADIAVLEQAYKALHPGLLRYNTLAQINARFAELRGAAETPMSLAAFYLRLSGFLGSIRCGHTYANFYNQRRAVAASLFEASDRLPLQFRWLGDEMIVTADPFGTGIAPGSAVRSINGHTTRAIQAALMPLARADGHNDGKRRRLLSVQGDDRLETFDVYFSLLFGRSRYRLLVEAADGRRRTTEVAAVSLEQRRATAHAGVDASGDTPVWTIERRGQTALLTMPNWALYDSRWDWRGWLDQEVDRLIADRVPRLVVDLRANEGGMDCGNALAARLLRQPAVFEEGRRLVRYRTIPAELRPYLDTWDRSFDHLGDGATRIDEHFYQLAAAEPPEAVQPSGRRYEGDVCVLIGPQNSSATFQFAELVRRTRIATLMGEPTGGNRRGINGGCFYFLRLPETGLEADLPLVGRFPTMQEPDSGVRPNIVVPVTRADIVSRIDRQLSQALS